MDGSLNPPQCVLVDRVASKTRIWSTVEVWSLRTNSRIATLQNVAGLTFQGKPVPNYPAVANHIDCGGSVQTFYSSPVSGTAQKNDCTDGQGSVVKYAIPGGMYVSTVSEEDANTIAQAAIESGKQDYANSNGTCQSNQEN
jgi:Family of unknown function (DUF5977)